MVFLTAERPYELGDDECGGSLAGLCFSSGVTGFSPDQKALDAHEALIAEAKPRSWCADAMYKLNRTFGHSQVT